MTQQYPMLPNSLKLLGKWTFIQSCLAWKGDCLGRGKKFKDCTSELGVFLSDNYKHLQKALNWGFLLGEQFLGWQLTKWWSCGRKTHPWSPPNTNKAFNDVCACTCVHGFYYTSLFSLNHPLITWPWRSDKLPITSYG